MKVFARYFGYILIISALFRIIPIAVGIAHGESITLFLVSAGISIALGITLLLIERKIDAQESSLTLAQGLTLAALCFIVLPLIGAISFLPSFNYNVIDASFESVSGFTTTGLTLYDSLDALPMSLLMWRALTQWIGGIGIIMIFLFIISRLQFHSGETLEKMGSQETATLYQAQGFPQKIEPGLKSTTRNLIIIYVGYTLIGVLLLFMVGMPIFDSFAMSFTSVSTGGFTVRDNFYSNNLQLAVLCLLMLLGSISFLAHNKLLQKKFKEFFVSPEKNTFFIFIFISILLIFLIFGNFKTVAFQVISSFTTTGYSLTKISVLPHFFIFIIMIGMMIGGGIASTSGGMKVSRIYTALASIPWFLKKLSSPPHALIPFKVYGKKMEEKDLVILYIFIFTFIIILLAGTFALMMMGYNFLDSSFQITSALGTVGLQTMDIGAMHFVGKLILMAAMVLGRLEIFPVLILIRMLFAKKS